MIRDQLDGIVRIMIPPICSSVSANGPPVMDTLRTVDRTIIALLALLKCFAADK